MTKDATLILHGATAITTRCLWINGSWHREFVVRIGENGDQELKLVVYGEDRLELQERPDEWVHVGDSDPIVERSNTPFNSHPSPNGAPKE